MFWLLIANIIFYISFIYKNSVYTYIDSTLNVKLYIGLLKSFYVWIYCLQLLPPTYVTQCVFILTIGSVFQKVPYSLFHTVGLLLSAIPTLHFTVLSLWHKEFKEQHYFLPHNPRNKVSFPFLIHIGSK